MVGQGWRTRAALSSAYRIDAISAMIMECGILVGAFARSVMQLRAAIFLVLAVATANAADRDKPDWTPDRAWILRVEASLPAMPDGARPLEKYVRYYTGVLEGGKRILVGVFELPSYLRPEHRPKSDEDNVRIGPLHHRTWTDSGCGVVYLVFDVATERVETFMCDGTA
jgi:hypothetical protein